MIAFDPGLGGSGRKGPGHMGTCSYKDERYFLVIPSVLIP